MLIGRIVLLLILIISIFVNCSKDSKDNNLQISGIPDPSFRAYCVQFDINNDNQLSSEELFDIKVIDVSAMRISSLEGIEYFTSLTEIYCRYNDLTELDVSSNRALVNLDCAHNKLIKLTTSSNPALKELHCSNNRLTMIDVSSNSNLEVLTCAVNQLTSLDVLSNPTLKLLSLRLNGIAELDLSLNFALETLICDSNRFDMLDISFNTALKRLDCYNNHTLSKIYVWTSFNIADPSQSVSDLSYDKTIATFSYKL